MCIRDRLWVGESSRTCFNAYYELVNSFNYNMIEDKLENSLNEQAKDNINKYLII